MLGSFAPIVDGLDRAPADCTAATFFFKKLHQNSGLQIVVVHGCARFPFWPLLSFCALGHFFFLFRHTFTFGTLLLLGYFHFWDTLLFGFGTPFSVFSGKQFRALFVFTFVFRLPWGLIFFLSIGG